MGECVSLDVNCEAEVLHAVARAVAHKSHQPENVAVVFAKIVNPRRSVVPLEH